MQRAGLTDSKMAAGLAKAFQTILEGLDATEEVYDKLGAHVATKADWKARLKATQQAFAVLLPVRTVGVMGDFRT